MPINYQGLYEDSFEHDACGIGMLVDIKGRRSHKLVEDAVEILKALTHRGGVGYEPETGDGAGILLQIPHKFMKAVASIENIELPDEPGEYGIAMVFASPDEAKAEHTIKKFCNVVHKEGLVVLGIRKVPTNCKSIGDTARLVCPGIFQVFIGKSDASDARDASQNDAQDTNHALNQNTTQRDEQDTNRRNVKNTKQNAAQDNAAFERRLFVISKIANKEIRYSNNNNEEPDHYFYLASISSKIIVYKGMLLPNQLANFYLDLKDTEFESAIALVHSRFSTNTFPSWERAHPMHHIIHNGEINTIRGNVNWVKAREAMMSSSLFGSELSKLFPVINEDGSDSAMFDEFLSLLMHAGYSLHEAVMMTIPEPWEDNSHMLPAHKAYYEFKSCLVEPWDGPASVAFTDGRFAGATLDRNGLRPSRYYVTDDDMLILSSEVGVLPIPDKKLIKKDRLRPGRMLLIDTQEGRIIEDGELKDTAAKARPYAKWLEENMVELSSLQGAASARATTIIHRNDLSLLQRQKIFGYSWEDINLTLKTLAEDADDPIAAMGYDAPLAVLSGKPQLLYNYFKQMFAQVTNPPIDAIREKLITSSMVYFGAEGNLLEPDHTNCKMVRHQSPILTVEELESLQEDTKNLSAITLPMLFENNPKSAAGSTLQSALDSLFEAADRAINDGHNIIILSDKDISNRYLPIPALLACAGLHHHLVSKGTRTKISIVVETAEAREAHHLALLVGYGANGVVPYLAYETLEDMVSANLISIEAQSAKKNYIKAMTKAIVKIASKMGIATVRSYHGAQVFEAIGISPAVINQYFTGTTSRIGGVTLAEIEIETKKRVLAALEPASVSDSELDETLPSGGDYKWRADNEYHIINPESIFYLQQACRKGDYKLFKKFSATIDSKGVAYCNVRDLLEPIISEKPIPIDLVEPASSIVQRFKTGAMSYGSISEEAHECMAIAMNNLKAKSNTGEGGEPRERFIIGKDGLNKCSAIKQVASGRFGVTIEYLNHAKEIQIKMAQGAKPGEGGHLPGTKVYPWVAKSRHSTPGVELISPPPHHDIYSIEDLAQLIFDLKNANRDARISVKLVSEAGVGTIAVGVAKGLADVIVISGFDGGTGAAPRTSIRHAGLPWELGVAEANQSLLMNQLRNRVRIETDGKLFTGRDVVVAALLGAEEFAFATAPLIAMGCDMLRLCNLNTCSVGIATQHPALRKNFIGKPEYIENLMLFIAEEIREWMALIGVKHFDELIGHVEYLQQKEVASKPNIPSRLDPTFGIPVFDSARAELAHWAQVKASKVDLSRVIHQVKIPENTNARYHTQDQDFKLHEQFDLQTLVPLCAPSLDGGQPLISNLNISNRNRTVATILSSELSRRYGSAGLKEDTIHLNLKGSGGQSFGAFLAPGITLNLMGDSNDYLGKGLSGGKIIVAPAADAGFEPKENIVVGNVAFYGATGGEAYIRGIAGERFCVRNSGVSAVVEGVGDHGCEYMTGGYAVILGSTGRNFAAGMSGGVALIYDKQATFENNCNKASVILQKPDREHIKILKALLENHLHYTGSDIAEEILGNFKESVKNFVVVIPRDYKKILDALKVADKEGIPSDKQALYAFNSVVLGKAKV